MGAPKIWSKNGQSNHIHCFFCLLSYHLNDEEEIKLRKCDRLACLMCLVSRFSCSRLDAFWEVNKTKNKNSMITWELK
jgi:hypothetical protein